VVLYASNNLYPTTHERLTHLEIAKRLAALKGFDFAGDYDGSCYPGPVYFVPSNTILAAEARKLGIRSEDDLFGGVVPYSFVGTKAITHPLVRPDAFAPVGWSHDFAPLVHGASQFGYSAFTLEDAHSAGTRLLQRGLVRIKPVRESGGRGQMVVSNTAELKAALDAMEETELASCGLVLEENLSDVTTYSVGQVRVAELVVSYYGTQRLTVGSGGEMAYGGSDLVLVRGNFESLLVLDVPDDVRIAVTQARAYDAAAMALFPGLFASRRNYDVAQGLGAHGRRRSMVLEQSWRVGGASGAEVCALEAFRAEPRLDAVRASCLEIYGEAPTPPPHAIVYFQGNDEQIGRITKYTLVEPYDDAR
jgi:hypothetical protein